MKPPLQTPAGTADQEAMQTRVLVIGRADSETMAIASGCGGPVVLAAYDALDAALLSRLLPAWIVAPLFAPGFDAIQLLERLNGLGYGGRVRIHAPALPDRLMVEAELRSHAPAIDLDLVARKT